MNKKKLLKIPFFSFIQILHAFSPMRLFRIDFYIYVLHRVSRKFVFLINILLKYIVNIFP